MGVNFKILPQKSFARVKETSASGFKMSKGMITVVFCTNSSGTHKLPLFVIDKAKNPQTFNNLNVSSLPNYYKVQKSA